MVHGLRGTALRYDILAFVEDPDKVQRSTVLNKSSDRLVVLRGAIVVWAARTSQAASLFHCAKILRIAVIGGMAIIAEVSTHGFGPAHHIGCGRRGCLLKIFY